MSEYDPDIKRPADLHNRTTPGEWSPYKYDITGPWTIWATLPIGTGHYAGQTAADVEFITTAHNALPALLEELQHARQIVRQFDEFNKQQAARAK